MAALAIGIGAVTFTATNMLNQVQRQPGLLPTSRPSTPPNSNPDAVNFLLLGSDSRGQDQGRSDVMMVLHLDPSRSKVYLVSVPRDLWVPIPGHGTNKINAAYAFGGAPLAVQTVEGVLDIRIDHVALTNFEGFFSLIDDLGGVTVNNPIASSNEGFRFPKGELKLTGESALSYVRQRYNLPKGDFDRAERQRLVVKAIIGKLADRGTLSNPGKLLSVVNKLSKTVTVDDGLTNSTIVSLAQSLRLNSGDDVVQMMVPVAGFGTSNAGASYVKPDQAGIAKLGKALRTGEMAGYRA